MQHAFVMPGIMLKNTVHLFLTVTDTMNLVFVIVEIVIQVLCTYTLNVALVREI